MSGRVKPVRLFPAAPIQRLIASKNEPDITTLATKYGLPARVLQRVMHAKVVNTYTADRLAIRLGTHPLIVWPDWKVTL